MPKWITRETQLENVFLPQTKSQRFFFFFFEKTLRQSLVSMKMAQQIIFCSDLHIKIDLRRRWSLKHWSLIYKEKDLKVVGYFERKTLLK